MTSRLAVIPARGGSARLKNKNIYPLNGKPLIGYSIEAVLDSASFDTVLVSTDSPDIAAVAKDYGIEVYDRPAEYATERITVLEAMLAMMEHVTKHDIFAYFLPTCPLVSPADITAGVELLDETVDSVNSVVRYPDPIQLAMIKKGDHMIPIFDNLTCGLTNSRYIQKYYKPSGAFYMSWWDRLLENRNFFVGNIKGHEMPSERCVDIDSLMDIQHAETVMKGLL